jgi:hypothetical protein
MYNFNPNSLFLTMIIVAIVLWEAGKWLFSVVLGA